MQGKSDITNILVIAQNQALINTLSNVFSDKKSFCVLVDDVYNTNNRSYEWDNIDVLLLELNTMDKDSLNMTKSIKTNHPHLKILIIESPDINESSLKADHSNQPYYLYVNKIISEISEAVKSIIAENFKLSELPKEYNKEDTIKVLAITLEEEGEQIKKILNTGASGYMPKHSEKQELLKAVGAITSGQNYISKEVRDIAMKDLLKENAGKNRAETDTDLTGREKDVLKLIVNECNNQEIADKLFISIRTVGAHRRNLLQKTGSRNTAGLVKFALENNIVNE